jgi:hypothetical protein
MVGERGLRDVGVHDLALRHGLRALRGELPDQFETCRVAEGEQHGGEFDVGNLGVGENPGRGGHHSSTSLELLLGRSCFERSM